jgi:hypothetical protein
VNPVEEVVFGRADFGITRSDLLLERMLGLPVVTCAWRNDGQAAAGS